MYEENERWKLGKLCEFFPSTAILDFVTERQEKQTDFSRFASFIVIESLRRVGSLSQEFRCIKVSIIIIKLPDLKQEKLVKWIIVNCERMFRNITKSQWNNLDRSLQKLINLKINVTRRASWKIHEMEFVKNNKYIHRIPTYTAYSSMIYWCRRVNKNWKTNKLLYYLRLT